MSGTPSRSPSTPSRRGTGYFLAGHLPAHLAVTGGSPPVPSASGNPYRWITRLYLPPYVPLCTRCPDASGHLGPDVAQVRSTVPWG